MALSDFRFSPLSNECLQHIEELDIDYDRDYPSEKDQEARALFRLITERIFHSRQAFTGDCVQEVEKLVQIVRILLLNSLTTL